MPKEKFSCKNCDCITERYRSTVRNLDKVFCSKKCKGAWQKGKTTGKDNPNYRDGKHCSQCFCDCGCEKDYRSDKCITCANQSKAKLPRKIRKTKEKKYNIDLRDLFSEEKILEAIEKSRGYKSVSEKLGISRYLIKSYIQEHKIDISHFAPGRGRKLSDKELFSRGSKFRNNTLKNRIISKKLIEYKCSKCDAPPVWNGEELTLQLDHINGINTDNRLLNLRFMCPNCHSQTPTFTGRNSTLIKIKERDLK